MNDDHPASTASPAGLSAAAEASDAFGAALYHTLAAGGGNIVFSPASVAAALQLALCGARGETAPEMATALRLAGPAGAADGLRLLSAVLDAVQRTGHLTVRMPDTMWVQSGLPVRPEFTAVLVELAAVTVRDADFAREADPARLEINRLIAEQTSGKITDLLRPGDITSLTRLVLASAVYLKAPWVHPFPANATADAPFYAEPGAARPVPMMRLTAQLGYLRGDGYQAVLLPYMGGRLAMAVVLPDGPVASLNVRVSAVGRQRGGGIRGLLAGAEPGQVRLSLPRFRLTARFELGGAMRDLGMVKAFSRDADFTGITTAGELHISTIAHKAYIDVDEQGTEAAAATAVAMRTLAMVAPRQPPVNVVVDRPFLFAIIETGTGLPLFLGQVTEPRSP
jgi:serpin B